MGFEQLAGLRAKLAEQAKKEAREKAPRRPAPAAKPGTPGAEPAKPAKSAKPGGKPGRPAHAGKPGKSGKPDAQAARQQTAPVDPVVRNIGKLQKKFPLAFPKNPAPKVPLKIGVFEDLMTHATELGLSEAELREAIRTWCRGARYWACLTQGAPRLDLAGQPAGEVTEADAARARPVRSRSRRNRSRPSPLPPRRRALPGNRPHRLRWRMWPMCRPHRPHRSMHRLKRPPSPTPPPSRNNPNRPNPARRTLPRTNGLFFWTNRHPMEFSVPHTAQSCSRRSTHERIPSPARPRVGRPAVVQH
jgi:ProP effector